MRILINKAIFLCCICIFSQCIQAQTPYVLNPDSKHWSLTPAFEILPDTTGKLKIEDIIRSHSGSFVPISQIKSPKDLDFNHIWLKINLLNKTNDIDFVLTTDLWDEVRLYYPDTRGNIQMNKTGVIYPMWERDQNLGRYLHVSMPLDKNRSNTIYIRLSQVSPFIVSLNQTYDFYKRLELRTQDYAEYAFFVRCIYFSFAAGVLMIVMVYKLVIFLYIRDVAYLFFVFFLGSWLLFIAAESQFLANYYMPENPEGTFGFFGIATSLSWISLLLFERTYLRLAEFSPKLNIYVLSLVTLQTLLFVLSQWNINHVTVNLIANFVIIGSIFYINIRSVISGFKPAVYFLIADSVFLFSSVLWQLTARGIVPYNLYVEPNNIGNLLQVVLFSLGLAFRFKVMQQEVQAHKEENQKMIERQKEMLELEVKRQIEDIQHQSEEIQVQNEELYQQREEIAAQRDYVENKNKELENINDVLKANESVLKKTHEKLNESQLNISQKNKELEEREKQMNSSFQAALSIQTAMLPYTDHLQCLLGEYFIIYQPKDVVSGDFYWAQKVGKYTILVTADCTGHGVPGALMSMIGNTVLDKVISLQQHVHPTDILVQVHQEIKLVLKQEDTNNIHGMDMSVLVMEDYRKGLTLAKYAGAKSSMYLKYPQEDKIHEIKGSRRAIGGVQNLHTPFKTREIILSPGTCIYMGSDGYADQNNQKRKKFGEKALKNLICEISNLPMNQQKEILEAKLKSHMMGTKQRDDILLLGFKIMTQLSTDNS